MIMNDSIRVSSIFYILARSLSFFFLSSSFSPRSRVNPSTVFLPSLESVSGENNNQLFLSSDYRWITELDPPRLLDNFRETNEL